ncbi:MAG: hypothetical protein R6T92_12550, partial [Desulfosalsimonadaceae bacterium]
APRRAHKGLGWALDRPVLGVHHMEAHLLAPMLEADPPAFPFLALLVSGGHTLLVEVAGVGRYHVLGESLDDAAGEAFDKTAKLLGLPATRFKPYHCREASPGLPLSGYERMRVLAFTGAGCKVIFIRSAQILRITDKLFSYPCCAAM